MGSGGIMPGIGGVECGDLQWVGRGVRESCYGGTLLDVTVAHVVQGLLCGITDRGERSRAMGEFVAAVSANAGTSDGLGERWLGSLRCPGGCSFGDESSHAGGDAVGTPSVPAVGGRLEHSGVLEDRRCVGSGSEGCAETDPVGGSHSASGTLADDNGSVEQVGDVGSPALVKPEQLKTKSQLSKEKRARYKANKKQRALGLASDVPEWRRRAAPLQERKGSFDGCDEAVRKQLMESRAERFVAENKLAIRKAEQALQLAESTDMEQLVKCQRVKLVKATEQSMVAIEKAHGTLVATGNVPGYAETLVSSMPSMTSGESITPDSSVSAKEVHAMSKALRDLTKEVEDVKAENVRLTRILDSVGVDPKLAKPDKEFWTVDSNGEFVDKEAIEYNFPDGYAMETTSEPDRDGKTRYRIVF